MSLKKYIFASFSLLLLAFAFILIFPAHSSAISTNTGGDGYIPFVYQGKIYNIFHHQTPSGNPNSPTFDLNCTLAGGAACATYPRYFSSDVGSSGAVGIGTQGTADIYTSAMPNATIVGSRLYYAAQRLADNGIGCFDLSTNTNCGYFQLGTLTVRLGILGATYPSKVDGIEQVGNKLYSFGDDLNMYCLDITNQASPVACTSQPFAVNSGITAQMPASTQSLASRAIHNNKIYLQVNYNNNTPAADTRITCYDPGTDSRCAGWTSIDVTGTSAQTSFSLFDFPDTSGNTNAFCTEAITSNTVQCWDYTTQLTVTPPPGIFSNITSSLPLSVRNALHVGNKSYFAVQGRSFTAQDAMAVCYDFTAQTRCSGFGTNGVKRWDGSDGDIAVNGGITRDYGYAQYSLSCFVGLGDAGVLWSFNAVTGKATLSLDCSPPATKIPAAAPNTGSHSDSPIFLYVSVVLLFGGALGLRRVYKSYR